MPKSLTIMQSIKLIGRPVFTTRELSYLSGKSMSTVSQSLNILDRQEVVKKLYHGIWAQVTDKQISPYSLIPHLFRSNRVYVSFLSALHLHDIIDQIPQVITLASTSHARKIKTAVGVFHVHKISPKFFSGFGWYKDTEKFLIAEPEKALADCIYLSTRKKNQYSFFPELHLHRSFRIQKVKDWIRNISDKNAMTAALKKLSEIIKRH